jgi:serine/threonine protein kinase/WD40 repeat protein
MSPLRTSPFAEETNGQELERDQELEQIVESAIARLEAGGSVDVAQLAGAHPRHAEELREILPALLALTQLGDRGGDSTTDSCDFAAPGVTEERTLGDFRLLRELGRGGMGVVYEAEQISLGRRVALKVLPFAAMLNQQQLVRFRNEARAAATLDHPNIVSIYSVGVERGVHFYAMQLIDGESLAQVIARLHGEQQAAISGPACADDALTVSSVLSTVPNASPREHFCAIARLGIQAAQALDHAHQNGVLHRDVKPGNLLVDNSGKLWITDFGLARMDRDAGLTMTGDLLGTLRYMSPEQALANRAVVDQRSDVYSLGSTLYELITLQPVFPTADRQELLQQIAFAEPRPPWQFNPAIPRDLCTIVLKSIEKNPADRYATAQELADDLDRFLYHLPIKARSATPVQRLMRWSRRHVAVMWSALAAMLVISAVLAGSTALIAESQQAAQLDRERAEGGRREAVAQRNEARHHQYVAEIVSGQSELEKGNIGRLHQKLIGHLPVGEEPDRRGWEWFYLYSLCHQEERMLSKRRSNSLEAVWSPDGKHISAAGTIWEADTGKCVLNAEPSLNLWGKAAWNPSGSQVAWATVADDSAIYLYDLKSCKVREFRGHLTSVWSVAFSPDGKRLASGSLDNTVAIWDVATGERLDSLPTVNHVGDVEWSPDGKQLAAGIAYGKSAVQVWDTVAREWLEIRENRGSDRVRISWRPDGNQIAVCTANRWYLLNPSDGTISQQHEFSTRGSGYDVAWNPDGSQLAIAQGEQAIVWDAKEYKELSRLIGHLEPIQSVTWSPDGKRIATSDGVPELRVWNLESATQPPPIETGSPVERLSWEADDQAIVSIGESDASYTLWRVQNWVRAKKVSISRGFVGKLSPDRDLIAESLHHDGKTSVLVKDARSGEIYSEWHCPSSFQLAELSWAPDSEKLAFQIASDHEFGFDFWSANDERHLSRWTKSYEVPGAEVVSAIAWSPNSDRLAFAGCGDAGDNGGPFWGSHVQVIDALRGQRMVKQLLLPGNRRGGKIRAFGWSGDGKYVACGSSEGLLEVVDAATGARQLSSKPFHVPITAIGWGGGGERLAVADESGTVKIIETQDGQELLSLSVAQGRPQDLAWSHDGRRLAAATDIGTLHIWDATRGYDFQPAAPRAREMAWTYFQRAQELYGQAHLQALELTVDCAPAERDFRALRGDALAKQGKYDAAAAEFAAAIPDDFRQGLRPALHCSYSLLGARDTDSFRDLRARLVAEFAGDEVWSKRIYCMWLCAITPDGIGDKAGDNATFTAIAESHAKEWAAELDWDNEGALWIGATLFRLGRLAESQSTLTKLVDRLGSDADLNGQYVATRSRYFLALVRQRMGHQAQAQRILAEAVASDEALRSMKIDWIWVVVLDTLRREANAMINSS